MTLAYADAHVPSPLARSRASMWAGILLTLLFVAAGTLCFRAIRWDRWAEYESNDRRWWKNLPGESYGSFKAWRARRASWERAALAAAISGASLVIACGFVGMARWRGRAVSRWLWVSIVLHGLVIAYFVFRWGLGFRHPYHSWTG